MDKIVQQSDLGKGIAISWFIKNGYTVSLPISRHLDYDIIVDKEKIQRIRIITTSYKNPQGRFVANLKITAAHFYGTLKVKKFNPLSCDFLFILCEEEIAYLIPSNEINTTTKVTLYNFEEFRIKI